MRKVMGHTAVSATQASSVTLMEPKTITVNLLNFQDGSHYKEKYDLNGSKCIKFWLENESNPMINF